MDRTFFTLGCVLAFLGVLLGAFGAHGLESRLPADLLETFEVGARYHVYHALALLAVAFAAGRWNRRAIVVGGWLLVAGIVLFSGSLYALALTGVRALGAITPIGGLLWLIGWATLAVGVWRAGSAPASFD